MTTQDVSKQTQWQKMLNYILGNQASWIANVGLNAGLFRAIADDGDTGITEEALAKKLDFKLRSVQVWCRAAYAFGFLDWDEQIAYRLAPFVMLGEKPVE